MIVIKDLKKAFGDHVVLPCVNMEIKEREVVVIIGPSGSGKSTLLRSITHLEQPTAGKIFIAGEEVDDKTNIDHIRAEVGMVFQHFNLFENMTVLQNLTLAPIQVRKMSKEKAEEIAYRLLDKVGLPMPTGLAGDYIWPTYETVEATIQGEGVALTDTEISMSKLTASPQRIGIAIPVTRQAINQTEGVVEMIVKKLMPLSVTMLLNKILFSTTKVTGATTLVGPFVALASSPVEVSAEPTFKEFNSLKAKVLATGVDGEHLCFVMTKAQKAIAEATPKDAGSGIMVCENDHIAGLPVFTTNYIGEGYIGLGDWRYQPMGLFGDISFIIDPYSQARKDAVDFVLNVNYGTTTLRTEAFALAKCKAADVGA